MDKRNQAILIGIITSFCYGLMSVFSRWMDHGFAPMTQVYLRVLGASFLGAIVFSKQINWKKFLYLSLRDWLILVLMGIGGYGLMVYAITRGALLTSLLNVSVVFSTVPFFVYLFGLILFKDKLSLKVLLLLTFSVWGIGILASGNPIPRLSNFGTGDWWVLLSTIMEAIWFIGIKLISQKLNGREIGVITQLIAGVTLIAASLLIHEAPPTIAGVTNGIALSGLIGGILVNIVTPVMSVFMFKHLNEVFATQLLLFENIFSLIIGWLFYQEVRTPIHLLGAVIVIGSVYLMNKTQAT